jgi:tetratricopeptide (TPR) repeat protein
MRARSTVPVPTRIAAAAALVVALCPFANGAAPGINNYRQGKFSDAYKEFQATLQAHPQTQARDELQFDSGAAAYKMKNYSKALELFSQALLSPDVNLQSKSHYNLGNTLYQRGEEEKGDEKKLSNWTNALEHYQETLKIEPQNKEAKENYEYVKTKIEELKNKAEQKSQQDSKEQQIKPSEEAKKAKEEADKAVRQNKYRKALDIMTDQLSRDPTAQYYADYIHRLQEINGINKTDNP